MPWWFINVCTCVCTCRKLQEWYPSFTHCDALVSKESLFPESGRQAYEYKCLWIPSSYKKQDQLVLRQLIVTFYVHKAQFKVHIPQEGLCHSDKYVCTLCEPGKEFRIKVF